MRVNALPAPVLPRGSFDGRNLRFPPWVGYTGNLPAYLRSAALAPGISTRWSTTTA